MNLAANQNESFIDCWNQILTPKWIRFRHLLSGNGKIHSDLAYQRMNILPGDRVLDVGCGFGESCLEMALDAGPRGEVVGLDCTASFLDIAERERRAAGALNVSYRLGDIETTPLPSGHFDVAFSRFGIMYCASPVRGLRNVQRAMAPGGRLYLITWRSIDDNACWGDAERIALAHLPAPGDDAATCGPGPFSMAGRDTNRMILEAAGFTDIELTRMDAEVCLGATVEEAIDYQVLVGPAGFVIREAGERGARALPAIRAELAEHFRQHTRADGSVWLGSSTWLIAASKPQ